MKKSLAILLTVGASWLTNSNTLGADIKARGSDSTLHVVKALAAAFEAEGGSKVVCEGGGSSAGVKGLQSGEVTLAFLSRELKSDEKAAGLSSKPYAVDGVVVIVHKDNPVTGFTLADLKDLFTGKSATWADGKPVVLFNRNSDSGTREVFQELVLGKDGAFSPQASVKHEGILVASVGKLPGAVAYTSLGEVDDTKVKVLTVNNVKPTAESLKNKSYPVARTPTLAVKGEFTGDTKAFVDFVLSPKGQAVVGKSGLISIQ